MALSRAKECFYVIGDMDVLASSAMVWRDVRAELERQNAIGRELVLQCQTHQNTTKVTVCFFYIVTVFFKNNLKYCLTGRLCQHFGRAKVRRVSRTMWQGARMRTHV